MTRLVAYSVTPEGHWDPVAFSPKDLKAKSVFIIVDDEKRKIWIWIGKGAAVKTRFISSTAATEIRRIYGLTYRVQTIDQGEETKEFTESIDSIPKGGLVPELAEGQEENKKVKKPKSSKTKKITTKAKKTKATTKKASTTGSKAKSTRKAPTRKTPAKKKKNTTKQKKTTSSTKKITPKPRRSQEITSLDNFIPQDTSIITTPPCPECGVGHLLPYSEKMEQEGRDDLILPFSRWICSKCDYSPTYK